MPAPDDALLRFCHPERILATTRLPGLDALDANVLAELYGIDAETHRRTRARWRREAEAAVESALDDELARGLRALPFRPGDRVLAVGDSITADRQSWVELLRIALAATRGRDRIEVANGGLSGDTTAGAVTRLRSLRSVRPDHVIVLLGTNDARRHGRRHGVMLVSHRETARNLAALRRGLAAGGAPIAWITPPPVCPARIASDPLLREADLEWRPHEVAVKRRLVCRQPDAVVDLWPAFGLPVRPELMLADGLHPSLDGQLAILRAVTRRLARGR
jgi:lysophospholipase L1-like esterase